MLNKKSQLLWTFLFFASCAASGRSSETITRLYNRDTEIRSRLVKAGILDTLLGKEMYRIDSLNTDTLKLLLGGRAWFNGQEVAAKDLKKAYMLLQHSTDHSLQKNAIGSVADHVNKGLLSRQELAMLEDRVLVFDSLPQRYGTQMREINGELVPFPIRDSATVDERRAEMGLPTLAKYIEMVKSYYQNRNKK
jgi:hypothetical protein